MKLRKNIFNFLFPLSGALLIMILFAGHMVGIVQLTPKNGVRISFKAVGTWIVIILICCMYYFNIRHIK